jgi:hypothetical protein
MHHFSFLFTAEPLFHMKISNVFCRWSATEIGREGRCYPFCNWTQVWPCLELGIKTNNDWESVVYCWMWWFVLVVKIQILTTRWTVQLTQKIKNTMIFWDLYVQLISAFFFFFKWPIHTTDVFATLIILHRIMWKAMEDYLWRFRCSFQLPLPCGMLISM